VSFPCRNSSTEIAVVLSAAWSLDRGSVPVKMQESVFTETKTFMSVYVEGRVHSRTGHEGPEGEQKYNSTLSLTSALEGGWWSTPRLGCFTPWKETRYPL
jgi:hypothetical protein